MKPIPVLAGLSLLALLVAPASAGGFAFTQFKGPGSIVSLNPQPLPPKETFGSLNPQPIPPTDFGSLNPRPIPPGELTSLNPQPIPPGEMPRFR
ncbi:MAG TPA: hypothetical protein VFE52_06855 [Devosia sp.]|nr:hypothetical protein [Devosia sp.]